MRKGRNQQLTLGATTLRDRIAPFVAPAAANRGAVVDDPDDFTVAQLVSDAFSTPDAAGGLTLAQIRNRVSDVVSPDVLDRRLDVFIGLDMLLPVVAKGHVRVYIFNPASFAAMLAFERLIRDGGIEELVRLLDATVEQLQSDAVTRDVIEAALKRCRLFFSMLADALNRLVMTGTLSELLEQSRQYESSGYLETLNTLSALVRAKQTDLEPAAYALTLEAQRYNAALEHAADRIIEEGARGGDYRVLPPEDYLALARTADVDTLAGALGHVVFDPARFVVDGMQLEVALDHYGVERKRRPAPPEPGRGGTDDPVATAVAADDEIRRRRLLQLEQLLAEKDAADLTSFLRSLQWPAASRLLADLLIADIDRRVPFEIRVELLALIDVEIPVTYAHPIELHRALRQAISEIDESMELSLSE